MSVTEPPTGMREVFYRFGPIPNIKNCKVFLPEFAEQCFDGKYKDLLKFESDIAQIASLVVLFSESPGSFAELGAFALEEEISHKILVFIEQYFYEKDSFIKHGPIRHLTDNHTEAAVCVLDGVEIGIRGTNIDKYINIGNINSELFKSRVVSAIDFRLSEKLEPRALVSNRRGHIIKVSVGILQQFGALTIKELRTILEMLGIVVAAEELDNLLLVAEMVEWISRRKLGLRTFFLAADLPQAMDFKIGGDAPHTDKLRWRLEIRDFWKEKDDERYQAIIRAASGAL